MEGSHPRSDEWCEPCAPCGLPRTPATSRVTRAPLSIALLTSTSTSRRQRMSKSVSLTSLMSAMHNTGSAEVSGRERCVYDSSLDEWRSRRDTRKWSTTSGLFWSRDTAQAATQNSWRRRWGSRCGALSAGSPGRPSPTWTSSRDTSECHKADCFTCLCLRLTPTSTAQGEKLPEPVKAQLLDLQPSYFGTPTPGVEAIRKVANDLEFRHWKACNRTDGDAD